MGIGLEKKDTAREEGTINSSATLGDQIVRLDECHECATIGRAMGNHTTQTPIVPDSFSTGPLSLSPGFRLCSLSPFLGLSTAVEMKILLKKELY